jgi:uncharacterized protein (TIGR03083 family)
VNYADHVAAIRHESGQLSVAARTAGIDAPVPSCPDWTVADLLRHIGGIQHWVCRIVRTRPKPPAVQWRQEDPPGPRHRFDWFDEGALGLADALAGAAPTDEVWTWTADHTCAFWARRMAHEVTVHRWDAQSAAGAAQPIDHAQAVDGIQEFFDLIPTRAPEGLAGGGESVHLHCTDGDGEWLVRFTADGIVVTREHAKGDVAARGSASDLLLLVTGRLPPDGVETFGDASLLARWQELARF